MLKVDADSLTRKFDSSDIEGQVEFRGWHEGLKQMLYPTPSLYSFHALSDRYGKLVEVEHPDKKISVHLDDFITWKGFNYHVGRLQPIVLLQYTGLKDSRGTKIYEGDIVFQRAEKFAAKISYDSWRGGTAYVKRIPFGFHFQEMNCGEWSFNGPDSPEWDERRMKVIGNIYENPELLIFDERSFKMNRDLEKR